MNKDYKNKDYKLVVVMPAGRQRYMEVFLPYILKQKDIFDEFRIWVNTKNQSDIDYMHKIADQYPDIIKLEYTTQNNLNVSTNIFSFFKNTIDENTVYLRFDDDIVWMEPDYIKKMYDFRINNPEPFLIYGNIINNAISDYMHQQNKVYSDEVIYEFYCCGPNGWYSPVNAENKHRTFLNNLKNKDIQKYKFGKIVLSDYPQYSINSICWFGKDFKEFYGLVDPDEEVWLTTKKSKELQRPCCINGNALCSHFAFFTQRDHMDSTDILEKYKELSKEII